MNKQPERTAKTRQLMIDAFWDIAYRKGIENVTISEIAKKAGFNRGTFYVYFADMPELLAQAEEDIIKHLQNRLETVINNKQFYDLETAIKKFADVFAKYDDKMFLLIGKNGDPNFRSVIIEEAIKSFRKVFKTIGNKDISEYVVAYITSAGMGLLTYWHETGKRISVEEFVKIFHSLVVNGLNNTIERI